MKRLSAICETLLGAISGVRRWLGRTVRRRARRIRYERVEEFPDRLRPVTLYVAGEEPYLWAAAMLCPCGCGDVVELNLVKHATPRWSVRRNRDGTVTLIPSVWRTKGCRSHFLIRNSRIEWCRSESDTSPGIRVE